MLTIIRPHRDVAVSDLGARIRRLMHYLQKEGGSNIVRKSEATNVTLSDEMIEHRWTRRERIDYVRTVTFFGLPIEQQKKISLEEAVRAHFNNKDDKIISIIALDFIL
jgi:hypothetical protein